MLEYVAFRLLSVIAPLVPAGIGYWLCDLAGSLMYLLSTRARASVRSNLSRVVGRSDGVTERQVRTVFKEGARYYFDTFRLPSLTDRELRRIVNLRGLANLEKAETAGKGSILLSAHLGSPALVAQMLAVYGRKVTTPAEAVKNSRLLDLMSRVRGQRSIRLLPMGPGITRELTAALRQNEIVGIVGDRDIQGTGIEVRLFGQKTRMPAGPAMLALRTGAAILPAFTYRVPGNRFEGLIQQPLVLERTGDLRKDVELNTQKVAEAIEEAVRRAPEQWVVFEPVWRPAPAVRGVSND